MAKPLSEDVMKAVGEHVTKLNAMNAEHAALIKELGVIGYKAEIDTLNRQIKANIATTHLLTELQSRLTRLQWAAQHHNVPGLDEMCPDNKPIYFDSIGNWGTTEKAAEV